MMMDRRYTRLVGLLLLCSLLLALAPAVRAQTATSTVISLADGLTTPGTLRYLLNQANATSTPTTIIFAPTLSGGTITPNIPLPLSGNIRLLAQDAAGGSVDITLAGSQLPTNTEISLAGRNVLRISSTTATVQGFNIVNFAGAGIYVSASPNCPANARVTISDNVLVATSTAHAIELDSGPGCAGVTISENTISQTQGSQANGIYLHKTLSSMATSTLDLIVSDNTITTGENGIYLAHRMATSTARATATLSGNRITGAHTGININSTTRAAGADSQVNATLLRNYITGATFGIRINLDGSGGSNTVTVNGSWNTVIGSSTLDLFASEYGVNGSQVGRGGFDVSGRLGNTIFNTQNIRPDASAVEVAQRLILNAYQAAQLQPSVTWPSYQWPASFTAHRHQTATLSQAGTGITSDEEYVSALPQVHADARTFSVVSSPTPPPDFGTLPVFANILFRNAAGTVVTLTQSFRVCLPLPADLSDAPDPRIAGRDGTVWRTLPSARSGVQICADLSGFPSFTPFTPSQPRPETPPENPGRGGNGGGGTVDPPPTGTVAGGVVGVLEYPQPAFFSGIGVISGWVCTGELIEVEVEVDGTTHRLEAASGTARGDVAAAGVCEGRGDVGFGLLFNWNLLGDGQHTMRALADGVEFDRAIFTVTTLGEEFVRGASGEVVVADFPSPGEQTRLVWEQAVQNFMLAPLSTTAPPPAASSTTAGPLGVLENPAGGSFQSGISVISGWVCTGEAIELEVDGTHLLEAASGTARGDVAAAGVCEGRGDVGFGLLFNWNLLGDGQHTIRALADGVEFDRATFTVTTLDEEFVREASGRAVVADFPSTGETVTLVWQQSFQNFVITNLE